MRRSIGFGILAASAGGFPLTEALIRRKGISGAWIVEAVCAGLVARDAAMIAAGTPKRLRTLPALLLWLELAAGALATGAGLAAMGRSRLAAARLRRAATAALFGLHTVRFAIYLRRDQGRKPSAAAG